MNELSVLAVLSDLDEDIIESTVPPSLAGMTPTPKVKGDSLLSRILSNGWVAAVLSTVVALAVIIAIVLAGRDDDPMVPPVGAVGESESASESQAVGESEPESESRAESESETLPHTNPVEPIPFTVRVGNMLAANADRLTVSVCGREPGEDISVLGAWKLERLGTDGSRQEIPVSLAEGSPDSFRAPSPDEYATGEVTLLSPALPSLGYGQYGLTVTRSDGRWEACYFYVVEAYTPITPAEDQPFRFSYSIEAPNGWKKGERITIYLFQQNISDESIVFDHTQSSSLLQPYCQLSMNMGGDDLGYSIPVPRDYTEDGAAHYGVPRGSTVFGSYSVKLPEDMPGGGRGIDLYIHYGDNSAWGITYEDAFTEYGMSEYTIYNDNGSYSPLREEWRVSRQQYDHEATTLPFGMPLSAEEARTRIEALKDSPTGLIVRNKVERASHGVYTLIVYDEGGREVARGEDITILNQCEDQRTYFVDLITCAEMNWDGTDEAGNWVGGTITEFEEYFFPFVRCGYIRPSRGVYYSSGTQSMWEAKSYSVTQLDESAMALPAIVIDHQYMALPVVALNDGVFAGCAATEINLPRTLDAIGTGLAGCPNLEKIIFRGTMEEWEAIDKPADWASGSEKLTQVICTDGEIPVVPAP